MKSIKPRALPLPDGACNEAFTLQIAARSSDQLLAAFGAKAARNDVVMGGRIDVSHLLPSIRTAMLEVWPRLRRLG